MKTVYLRVATSIATGAAFLIGGNLGAGAQEQNIQLSEGILPEQTSGERLQTFSGNASWYGIPFHGKKTASGEIFDMNKLSAAHFKLHLVSKVLVENPRNGQSAVVRVNDRGPFVRTRVMDLSRAAAIKVGTFPHGVGYVECTVLNSRPTKQRLNKKDSIKREPEGTGSQIDEPKNDDEPTVQ
jgi:rare lipoprotein A